MKHFLRYILQKCLGFNNYLFLFAIITIKRIRLNASEAEFLHFVKIVPNEGVILDIGANIGITTVPLAQEKPQAQIYSFEPMPDNLSALRKIVKFFKLKNVKVFDLALGDGDGELKMIMPVIKNVKMQGLSRIYTEGTDTPTGAEVTVQVKCLDNLPELQSASKISAIKIDVENFEYFVLAGGEKLLSKHKPIIYCELWENEKRKMTVDFLGRLGYEVKIFRGGELINIDDQSGINFFFIPHNRSI